MRSSLFSPEPFRPNRYADAAWERRKASPRLARVVACVFLAALFGLALIGLLSIAGCTPNTPQIAADNSAVTAAKTVQASATTQASADAEAVANLQKQIAALQLTQASAPTPATAEQINTLQNSLADAQKKATKDSGALSDAVAALAKATTQLQSDTADAKAAALKAAGNVASSGLGAVNPLWGVIAGGIFTGAGFLISGKGAGTLFQKLVGAVQAGFASAAQSSAAATTAVAASHANTMTTALTALANSVPANAQALATVLPVAAQAPVVAVVDAASAAVAGGTQGASAPPQSPASAPTAPTKPPV